MKNPLTAEKIIQKLKAISELDQKLSFNELRVIFSMERAVARIEKHAKLNEHLIFKGGFLLLKITDTSRFTRDVDVVAENISKQDLPHLLAEAMTADIDDGCWFGDIQHEDIMEQGKYGGMRFSCAFHIGVPEKSQISRLSRIQIDVAFGDKVKANEIKTESILPEYGFLSWRVYPIEYVIAEKLETTFKLGSANSRAKDIFDIVFLYSKYKHIPNLRKAIDEIFKHRGTPIPNSFYNGIQSIDSTILESAWRSVQLTEEIKFNTVWKKFKNVMKELDLNQFGAKPK